MCEGDRGGEAEDGLYDEIALLAFIDAVQSAIRDRYKPPLCLASAIAGATTTAFARQLGEKLG